MGSESKSRKRRSSSEEGGERSEKRRRKEKKSHKDKEKKSSKKEKKSSKKKKSKHPKSDRHGVISDIQELSKDDYFAKNNEFATWLKEEKSVFFSDLSSESAREMFTDFIKQWNNQKLESRYYEGISSAPRTSHNWNIKQQ